MSVRSVIVRLEAEVAGYIAGMGKAAKATDQMAKSQQQMGPLTKKATEDAAAAADKQRAATEKVGEAATIAGAATLAGVGMAIKSYADFDKQMSSVGAATHETAGNMDLLRQAAIDAGADTAYSATEAAQGIEELAKAGVSTKDILAGGLDGALSLAAAGALGVGEAAEIAASALTQFKLSGDKVPHLADLLAAGAGKAQGSVQDLGAALNQSGLVASSTGATIEETTGALAAFASAGLTGSDAGTSFKTMLMSLNPNSEAAATLMDELGISAYDAQGKFVGMSEYAGILQNALKDMSDEQRNATLKTLFGTDAVRAANVMYEQGAAGIQSWENAVNDAGYAAETAAMMQDNLAGDLEKLGGAFDTVLLQSGSGANEVLRGLVQGLEGLLDAVGQIPGPVLNVTLGLAAVLGGAALLGGGLVTVIPKIAATKEALALMAPAGSKAQSSMSKLGRVASGAAAGLSALAAASMIAQPALDKILAPTGETADALKEFAGEAGSGAVHLDTLNKSFQDLVQHQDGVSDFQQAINGIADPGLWGNIDNIAVGTIKVLSLGMVDATSTSDKARERFAALGDQLASLDPERAAGAFRTMADHTDGSSESLSRLLEYMPAYRKSLEDQAKAAGLATNDQALLDIAMGNVSAKADGAATAVDGVTTATGEASGPSQELADALADIGLEADGSIGDLAKFTEALTNAGLLQLSARDAARNYQEAIDKVSESVTKNGTTLDINTEQGRANQAALDGVASAGLGLAKANANAGASEKSLQGDLQTTYNNLIASAGQFGITGGKADELARKVLGVPPGVSISSWMSGAAKQMAEQTKGAVDNIPKVTNIQVNTFRTETTFQKVLRSISTAPAVGEGTVLAPPRAGGGDLDMAPGPKGVDSQLFFGAKGEHVFTAREVDLMGGQDAVYRFRANVRAGNFQGLAGGGTVGGARASYMSVPAQVAARSTSAPALDYGALADAVVAAASAAPIHTSLRIGQREFASAVSSAQQYKERA